MYTPEDSPFEKFRTEKLKGVAMSPDVLELVAKAYEGGFIDGMQKQMQSSVDRAVNRMAEQPAQQQEPVACAVCNEVHAILDADASRIIRNAADGYPEGRASRVLTLQERVDALCVYAADWRRWYLEKENAPPASKPLTDEQILSLVPGLQDCLCDPWDYNNSGDYYASIPKDMIRLARAIEAAHGIKGDA